MKFARVLISISILAATAAQAQPDPAQAEALFVQGRKLLGAGKAAEACAAFDASQKLDPSPSTVLNQGFCREQLGKLASAWGFFSDVQKQTRGMTDSSRRKLHDDAVTAARALEPRLSTLAINVSDTSTIVGLEILRNADVVDVGAWNRTLPIDGGTYKITARAPGNAEWTTTITIANERDVKIVEVPRLKAADIRVPIKPPSDAPKPATPDPTPPVQPTPHPAETTPATSRLWLGAGAGSLALLGGALTFELVARRTYDRAKTDLDPDKQLSLWNTANHQRYAATGFALAGAATAGVAVWLYIRGRRPDRVTVAPVASSDRVGIQLAGGF